MIYKGYNVKEALLGIVSKCNNKLSSKHLFRFFLKHDLSLIDKIQNIITTSDLSRKEYIEIFDKLKKKKGMGKYSELVLDNGKLKFELSVLNICRSLFYTYKYKWCKGSILAYFQVSAYLCYILNTIDTIPNNKPYYKIKVLSFMPLYGPENIVAQYAKKRTDSYVFMYQHAMFQYDDSLSPIDNILFDFKNYNSVDAMLVWGEATRVEMEKHLGKKAFVAGSLLDKNELINHEENNILLLTASDRYSEQNKVAISFIIRLFKNYTIYVKKHPTSKIDINANIVQLPNGLTIKDAINMSKCKFAVVVNSTAYYDIYRFGVRCFKLELDGMRKLNSICDDDTISESFDIDIESALRITTSNKQLEHFFSDCDRYESVMNNF